MDSAAQAAGEKQVERLLIEPLLRRGLAKPGSLTKAQFDDMTADLCKRLAYMSDLNLAALEEEVAGMAGGRDKDRFPIGQRILERAAQVQPPGDDASPLIRAVFANQLGIDALTGGWAPELLIDLRMNRRWPGAWAIKCVKENADGALRQMRALEESLARGHSIGAEAERWRARRLAAFEKCRRIAGQRADGGAA